MWSHVVPPIVAIVGAIICLPTARGALHEAESRQAGKSIAVDNPIAVQAAEAVAHRELERIRADGRKIGELEGSNGDLRKENARLETRMHALEQGGSSTGRSVGPVGGPTNKRIAALNVEVSDLKQTAASATMDSEALVGTVQRMLKKSTDLGQEKKMSSYVRSLQEQNAEEDKENQQLRSEVLELKKREAQHDAVARPLKKTDRKLPKLQSPTYTAPLAASDGESEANPAALEKIMDFTANFAADSSYAREGKTVPIADAPFDVSPAQPSFAQRGPKVHSLNSFLGAGWQKPATWQKPPIKTAVAAQSGSVLSKWLWF